MRNPKINLELSGTQVKLTNRTIVNTFIGNFYFQYGEKLTISKNAFS